MKLNIKTFFYLTFALIALKSYSQQPILNCVTYKVNRYSMESEKESANDEQLKAFRSLEYQLVYSKSKSIYQPVKKLQEEDNNMYFEIAQMIAGTYFFKDLDSKEKLEQCDAGGEMFYVLKDFDEYKWEITNETKIIDGYECIKAISYKEEYSGVRNRIVKFYPTVWFAPEIPAPFGPAGLDGVPGLVLEGTFNGKIFFYATTIDLNCSTQINLEKPKSEKYVSEVEFVEIVNKVSQNLLNGRP